MRTDRTAVEYTAMYKGAYRVIAIWYQIPYAPRPEFKASLRSMEQHGTCPPINTILYHSDRPTIPHCSSFSRL